MGGHGATEYSAAGARPDRYLALDKAVTFPAGSPGAEAFVGTTMIDGMKNPPRAKAGLILIGVASSCLLVWWLTRSDYAPHVVPPSGGDAARPSSAAAVPVDPPDSRQEVRLATVDAAPATRFVPRVVWATGQPAADLPYRVLDERVFLDKDWSPLLADWEHTEADGRCPHAVLEHLSDTAVLAVVVAEYAAATFALTDQNRTFEVPPLEELTIVGRGIPDDEQWSVTCEPPRENALVWSRLLRGGAADRFYVRAWFSMGFGNEPRVLRSVAGSSMTVEARGSRLELACVESVRIPGTVVVVPTGTSATYFAIEVRQADGAPSNVDGIVRFAGSGPQGWSFSEHFSGGRYDTSKERLADTYEYTVEVVLDTGEFFTIDGQRVRGTPPEPTILRLVQGEGQQPITVQLTQSGTLAYLRARTSGEWRQVWPASHIIFGRPFFIHDPSKPSTIHLHSCEGAEQLLAVMTSGLVLGCALDRSTELAAKPGSESIAIEPRHFGLENHWPPESWLSMRILFPDEKSTSVLVDKVMCHDLPNGQAWEKIRMGQFSQGELTLYSGPGPLKRRLIEID